jgi:hypothetical protein
VTSHWSTRRPDNLRPAACRSDDRASTAAGVFRDVQDTFSQTGEKDSVFPIRHFYQRWGAAIAIERRPSVAAQLHAAERALTDPGAEVRDRAIREAAEIIQAAYREVAGG